MAKRPTRADPRRLELFAPDPRLHGEELIDLIAKSFGSYFRMRDNCRKGYVLDSHYDWQASRIGLIDGRIVTHYGVWGYDMRIGAACVRVGGIGGVATHAGFRKRGLMAKTVAATIEAMSQVGYDMTVLFGIPDLYHRFGYVRAWPLSSRSSSHGRCTAALLARRRSSGR
jgi:predicted acetyltransferase